MEENQHHLYIGCEASKSNFVVPNFWFLFWNCLEKWIHLFLQERFPSFWDLMWDLGISRTMKHCVHRKYPIIL